MSALVKLTASERRRAAETLAVAFHDDPLFAWALPHAGRRRAWLHAFFRATLWLVGPADAAWRTSGDGRPDGVISALPPSDRRSLWRDLVYVLRLLPRAFIGQPGPVRLIRLLRVFLVVDRVRPAAPNWYVMDLAVAPGNQGRGLGKTLLNHVIGQAERDGVPVYLETSNVANLDFYRRFGFELRDTFESVAGAPPVWTMLRPVTVRPD